MDRTSDFYACLGLNAPKQHKPVNQSEYFKTSMIDRLVVNRDRNKNHDRWLGCFVFKFLRGTAELAYQVRKCRNLQQLQGYKKRIDDIKRHASVEQQREQQRQRDALKNPQLGEVQKKAQFPVEMQHTILQYLESSISEAATGLQQHEIEKIKNKKMLAPRL